MSYFGACSSDGAKDGPKLSSVTVEKYPIVPLCRAARHLASRDGQVWTDGLETILVKVIRAATDLDRAHIVGMDIIFDWLSSVAFVV